MINRKLAIALGSVIALAIGLYLGGGAQAGNCDIGGDVGSGVTIQLAQSQNPEQGTGQSGQEQPQDQKGAPTADQPQSDKGEAGQQTTVPGIPRVAPDEGC